MPESISRIWHVARRVLTSLPVLIVTGLFVLYVLLGYFAVGPLMRHYVPRIAQSQLDSRASVREVRFDPLRLTLTVDDLRLTTPQGQPLAGFSRLFVDFAPSSLFRWAWTFRQIRVDRPQVDVGIARGGAMNWDGLVRALQRGPKPQNPSDAVVRLVIDQLHITNGIVRYADADRDQPYSTRLTPLNLNLDNLSTLPHDRGDYALSLQLPEQHATLRWKGYVGLNPLVSGGQAELTGLDLAATARAVPGLKRVAQIAAGTATVRAAYSAVLGNSGLQWAVNDLGVQVDALSAKSGDASLQVQQTRLAQGRIDGSACTASLQALTLTGIAAASGASRLQLKNAQLQGASLDWGLMEGVLRGLDLQSLQARTGLATLDAAALRIAPVQFDLRQSVLQVPRITLQDARAHSGQEQAAPWLALPKLQVDAVRADLAQHRLQLGEVDVQAGSVRLTRLADGRFDLLQALSAGAEAAPAPKAQSASAQTTVTQRNSRGWTIDLQQLKATLQSLDYTDQSLKQTLGLQLKDIALGSGAVSAQINPGHAPALTLTGLGARLGALTLQSDKQDLATWAQASLGPTDIALPAEGAPRVQAGALQIDDLAARVRLAKDGLNWKQALQPASAALSKPMERASQTVGALPEISLESAQLRNFSAQLQDDAEPLPIRLDLIQGQASARNVSLNLRKPVPVQLRFAVRQGGRFDARGQIAPQPLAGSLAVQLHDLSLMPFGALLQP
ncbi:AsmA family protein [mine drainage metagenome]|uniref:AsmA family protein n=1 Tax=mine drainage metagenome TaxID=410659 RepID=A0A1J5PXV6_9ZZZZ